MKGLLLLFFLVAPALQAQDTEIQDQSQDHQAILRRDHRLLQRNLALITDGLPLTATEKIELLADFLRDHSARPGHPLVLQTRSRLGDLYLLHDAPRALEQFDAILVHGEDLADLRGRAAYGRAQAQLQMGNARQAMEFLRTLVQDEAGTRYGRYARTALEHLNTPSVLRAGLPLPNMTFGRDLSGKALSTQTLRGDPALLVFWSPDSPTSIEMVERLADAWTRNTTDEIHFVALALDSNRTRAAAIARQRNWRFTTVLCEGGFLDPTALTLRVTGVPTSFLLGADGTYLARDLSPDRLSYLLRRARGR
jgi:hypothetical protein